MINRGKKGIFSTFIGRTVEGNRFKQLVLGFRLVDDLQHPRARLALAITSSCVWHTTSPLDIFWSRRSSSSRNSSETGKNEASRLSQSAWARSARSSGESVSANSLICAVLIFSKLIR